MFTLFSLNNAFNVANVGNGERQTWRQIHWPWTISLILRILLVPGASPCVHHMCGTWSSVSFDQHHQVTDQKHNARWGTPANHCSSSPPVCKQVISEPLLPGTGKNGWILININAIKPLRSSLWKINSLIYLPACHPISPAVNAI